MSLFQLGAVTLHSGAQSDFKIDCDALTDADIECLAYLISKRVKPFYSVEGIPTGGIRLARALKQYLTSDHSAPMLLVDDVFTTGTSMEVKARACRPYLPVIGAVIFSRGPVPDWITPLFRMEPGRRGVE